MAHGFEKLVPVKGGFVGEYETPAWVDDDPELVTVIPAEPMVLIPINFGDDQ